MMPHENIVFSALDDHTLVCAAGLWHDLASCRGNYSLLVEHGLMTQREGGNMCVC